MLWLSDLCVDETSSSLSSLLNEKKKDANNLKKHMEARSSVVKQQIVIYLKNIKLLMLE